ncbi:MAG: phosphoribosylamine--glycine ligase [Thermoplasmataceae archaeon]
MTRVLVVGGGGREDAICRAIAGSGSEIYSASKNQNPSIMRLSKDHLISEETDVEKILRFATDRHVDIAIIGPDPVLNTPLADRLWQSGIPVGSPSLSAARIETSKEYMRNLLNRHSIKGNLFNRTFSDESELEKFILSFDSPFVVKPIGLTGGKGVRVMGDHFTTPVEGLHYAMEVLRKDGRVLIEERVRGEEFSLQVFTDGEHVAPMPLAQDYKRAYDGDMGPNTGGMGSITDSDHSLPFIKNSTLDAARAIVSEIVKSMKSEGNIFRGIMYAQFMQTSSGPKVIEINARFADPEGINVLTILEDNLTDILFRITDGTLKQFVDFRDVATTLKYIVPVGYGSSPEPGNLTIEEIHDPNVRVYYGSVSGTLDSVMMSSSRALAVIAESDTISHASELVERNLSHIKGRYYVRHDIGSEDMIKRKIMGSA